MYIYIYIYVVKKTDNVSTRLLSIHMYSHGNSCTWEHDVRLDHVPKCMSYHEATDGLGLVITERARCLSL